MIKLIRKAIGVILLCIGIPGLMIIILGTINTLMGDRGDMSLDMGKALIFYPLYISMVIGGVLMWGWDRRRIVFGIVLTIIGGLATFSFILSIPVIMSNPSMRPNTIIEAIAPIFFFIIFPIVFTIAGIILIKLQRKKDRINNK